MSKSRWAARLKTLRHVALSMLDRAEQGDVFCEHHLAFESWDTLTGVLTAKRLELLRDVRRHEVASVRVLAKALGAIT